MNYCHTAASMLTVDILMRRADRLLRVIQLLRRYRRPVTGRAMATELEISLRTLYRDIADLITEWQDEIRKETGRPQLDVFS